jgi:chemotaxis protein MotB
MRLRSLSNRNRPARDRRRRALACGSAVLAAGLLGCVGLGTHREVVTERDRLAERVKLLEASNESLASERVSLLEQLEDVRVERTALDRNVQKLREKEVALSRSLSAREAELARQNAEVARLRGTYEALVDDLESELAAGQIEIQQLREGLRVNVSDEILFASGSASVGAEGSKVLLKVAKELAKLPHAIEVEGHTDNVPITGSLKQRYASNWELAAARAASVVRLFERAGVEPSRLVAVSHASTRPVASNDTAEGRSRNRRIEIRLRPEALAGRGEAAEGDGGGAASGS